jgi:chaperone modulatory protein CbpM
MDSASGYAARAAAAPPAASRVTLGLLEMTRDAEGGLWFEPSQIAAMAKIQRLHRELNLSRIAQLERLQRQLRARGGDRWT